MYHLFWSHSHVQVPVYWIVLLLSTTYCLLVNYTITSHLMSWEHCWVYLVKRCVCVCMCVCLSVCGGEANDQTRNSGRNSWRSFYVIEMSSCTSWVGVCCRLLNLSMNNSTVLDFPDTSGDYRSLVSKYRSSYMRETLPRLSIGRWSVVTAYTVACIDSDCLMFHNKHITNALNFC